MLHWWRETWQWHRRSEGNHPPSETFSLHDFVVSSNNRYKLLNRSNKAGFCFVRKQTPGLFVETFPQHIED